MELYIIANRTAGQRPESIQIGGADYLKVPAVLLVEGVHVGSGGPIYYSSNVLRATAEQWNGVAITVNHPTAWGDPATWGQPLSIKDDADAKARLSVGFVMDTAYRNGALTANLYLDIARLGAMDGDTLARIQAGDVVEISTGLLPTGLAPGGAWKGEGFDAELTAMTPDHLAVLTGQTAGACSCARGCGANRVANCGVVANCDGCNKECDCKNCSRKGEETMNEKIKPLAVPGEGENQGAYEGPLRNPSISDLFPDQSQVKIGIQALRAKYGEAEAAKHIRNMSPAQLIEYGEQVSGLRVAVGAPLPVPTFEGVK
jgi:hypothetical protein